MNIFQSFDCFEFHDDLIINEQIQTMDTHFDAFKDDPNFFLMFIGDVAMIQGDSHGILVDRFQIARPLFLVNVNGGFDNFARKRFEIVTHLKIPF
jgi:hypothetical protein